MQRHQGLFLAFALTLSTSAAGAEPTSHKTVERPWHLTVGAALYNDSSGFNEEANDLLTRSDIYYAEDNTDSGSGIHLGFEAGDYFTVRLGRRHLAAQNASYYVDESKDDSDQKDFVRRGSASLDTRGNFVATDWLYPLKPGFFAGVTLGVYDWTNEYNIKLQSGDRAVNESAGTDAFAGVRAQLLIAGGKVMLVAAGELHQVRPGGIVERLSYQSVGLGLEARF